MSDSPSRARIARTAVVGILLVLALMWIYVLFVASPSTDDKLDTAAFPTAAQPVCQSTLDDLKRSGVVNQVAATPEERGALVDAADAQLTTMVQKLRTLVPPPGNDADAVSKWLSDWDQWLRDRATWSGHLHNGEDAPFLEKQREDGSPYSKALNAFATTNNMQACSTPIGI